MAMVVMRGRFTLTAKLHPCTRRAVAHASSRCFSCSRPLASSRLEVELTAPNGTKWAQPLGLFIGNEFIESEGGDKITTINPYTEQDICSVFAAKQPDVDKAVQTARQALKHPSWKLLSGTDRGYLMNRLADLVDQHSETLAAIETLDNGKPFSVSRGFDVPHFSEVLRYYAGYADKNPGSVIDVGPKKMAYTLKQPVGVCGQIIPWNYPLDMAAWKLGPALCCGNVVVLKLAEQTPLSMLYVAKLIREAGFPPGVINVINGRGGEAGVALAKHSGVDKIAFTGSTATGKEVMRMAAGTMKAVTLETGGKSPLIVFDDADLEQAVRWAHEGIMANQGQVCTATSRLLVQDGIYDTFVEKFKAYTEKASILGDPFFFLLDRDHPISQRIDKRLPSRLPQTRLQRTAALAGRTVRPTLFAKKSPHVLPGPDMRSMGKPAAAKKHLEMVDSLPPHAIAAYSDGSQTESGTGWGAVVYHRARAYKDYGRLDNAEVYDAEARAALGAMKLIAERVREDRAAQAAFLFLDNSSVVDGLQGKPPTSMQDVYIRF